MTLALAGLGTGALHAMTGPDHVLALAPLTTRARRGWAIGARWGAGHALGTVAVAILAVLIARDLLAAAGDLVAGAALIAVGALALARRAPAAGGADRAAVGIGFVHGLAGGAAVIALLPAIAAPSPVATALYLVGFSIGSTLAMAMLADALARAVTVPTLQRRLRGVTVAVACASIVAGVLWLVT